MSQSDLSDGQSSLSGTSSDICVVCQSPIEGEFIYACPACRSAHHADCWTFNHGCGVYGCRESPPTEGLSGLEIPASHWGSSDKTCPNCGKVILAAALRCRHCGVTFSSATPQASHAYRAEKSMEAALPGLRTFGIGLLIFALIPCTAPLAAIVGSLWYINQRRAIQRLPAFSAAICKIALGLAWVQSLLLTVICLAKFALG